MRTLARVILLSSFLFCSFAPAAWRQASESELKALIPDRAPVEKERIETEFRTASGITNGKGKFIAGVVLITAGYAAEGKYSNFLIVQSAMKIGGIALPPGDYVFGWRRKNDDSLAVKLYDAHSGRLLGEAEAKRMSRTGKIESFKVSPPGDKAFVEIGRFGMSYSLAE
jgi:hypothetical protein